MAAGGGAGACRVPTSAARPSRVSIMLNQASEDANLQGGRLRQSNGAPETLMQATHRMSAAHIRSTPPPTHAPWMAAMTGTRARSSEEMLS
jgi:hypothetical protein